MKEKRIRIVMLCCVLAAALSLSLLAAPLVTATENAELLAGTVHDIYTAADLAQMAGKSDTYYLRNDLDLTNYGNWTPINFSGIFDGQGHTIKGIKVSGYDGYAGFFSTLSGTVRNLHLEEVDIAGTLTNPVGGLAGYSIVTNAQVAECVSVSGRVRGNWHVGGLIGAVSSGRNAQISNCYSTVSVSVLNSTDNINAGCGGLVGKAASSTIQNCYATGTVTLLPVDDKNRNNYRFNGLLGYLDNSDGFGVNVVNSYYCNYNNSNYSGCGVYISEDDMKQQSTYVDWDFSTVWKMSASQNDGFPYLRDPAKVSPTDVSLNMTALTLEPEDSQMLQATILPANATARHLDWYSSDTNIVELTPVSNSTSGEINARMMANVKAAGVAVVTAVTTEGKIEAACTVTVSDGKSEPLPAYRLNGIAAQDSDGNALTAVPSGSFLATVSIANIASADSPTIVLAAYTAEKKYVGLFYVTLKSPVGGTVEATIPVDNSAGNIAELKAFAVSSFSDLSIIGNPVSFPAK